MTSNLLFFLKVTYNWYILENMLRLFMAKYGNSHKLTEYIFKPIKHNLVLQ